MNAVELYTEDRLIEILKPYDWVDLEDTVSGSRKFGQEFYFHLRVGYFMKRPMRVVVACGKYVWMKEEKVYCTGYDLRVLDPAKPDNNVYSSNYPDAPSSWRPVHLYSGIQGLMNVASTVPYGSLVGISNQQVTSIAQQQAQYVANTYYSTSGLGHAPSLPRVK